MGKNMGSAFRKELVNLEKDLDTHKTAISKLRTIVKGLDAKVIHMFVAQLSEVEEIGSESGGYTVSLLEDLAFAHGVKISPHVEIIMPAIIRTLSSSEGSLSVQQACSKAVAAMARFGIDPTTPEDKKRNVIHSLCKPLSDSLIDSQHQQHLALGSAVCLKSLVDCNNWRYASDEMVNKVCQSLAVALEATSSEVKSHIALVIALAKHNPFIVEAYARLLVKSGLRILDLGVVDGDSQKRLLAIQMLNFLMKNLNPMSICSERELIFQEMEKHQRDEVHYVKMAACETMRTAERLLRETDPVFDAENCKTQISLSRSFKSTPRLRAHDGSVYSRHDGSYVDDQEDADVMFSGVYSGRTGISGSPLVTFGNSNQEIGLVLESPKIGNQIQCFGVDDGNIESVWFHQRSGSSDFNESVCSRTNRSRSSRQSTRRQSGDICSKHHRHGFAQDPFTEMLEQRQHLQQCSESSSSSSSIYDTSGTTTPSNSTVDICEKQKSDLDSEDKLKTGETEIDSRIGRSKRVLKLGLSFCSIAVAGFASFIWIHLQDDMMPPHLVPT